MKEDKFNKYHSDAFKYEYPKDNITPGFIFGVIGTILAMVAIIAAFTMFIYCGIIIFGA